MSDYQTTTEQRQQLLTDGFVLLPDAVPADVLARWRALAARIDLNAQKTEQERVMRHLRPLGRN